MILLLFGFYQLAKERELKDIQYTPGFQARLLPFNQITLGPPVVIRAGFKGHVFLDVFVVVTT